MKPIFIFISLLLIGSFAQAQLPMVGNKISYEEVVKVDSTITKAQLYKNAETWVLRTYNDKDCNIISTPFESVQTNGFFMVYTKGAISKEIHGMITYNLGIEVKDGKYRYKFTDFLFHYYKITRTYKYEATGKTKPLEDPKFPGWEPAWKRHKKDTDARINSLIVSLKASMLQKSAEAITEEKLKAKKEDW